MPGNTDASGDRGPGATGVQEISIRNNGEEQDDGTKSYRGENQLRSFVYPAVPSSLETSTPPIIQKGEAGEGGRHLTEGPPPSVVRVGVWDTATATSNSNSTLVGSSQSNHFNINLSGSDGHTIVVDSTAVQKQRQPQPSRREISSSSASHDDGEVLSSRNPVTPSKYESLLEKPADLPAEAAAAAAAISGGSASTTSSTFYPQLVDRNGFPGGFLDVGGGGNGLRENGTGGNVGKAFGTSGTEELDRSLADAAERSLTVEDKGLHGVGVGGGK